MCLWLKRIACLIYLTLVQPIKSPIKCVDLLSHIKDCDSAEGAIYEILQHEVELKSSEALLIPVGSSGFLQQQHIVDVSALAFMLEILNKSVRQVKTGES